MTGHSTFITSQSLFVPMNMVLKRCVAYQTFSKHLPCSNKHCLSICAVHTLIKLILTSAAQLCLWRALRYRDYEKYTCEITMENSA